MILTHLVQFFFHGASVPTVVVMGRVITLQRSPRVFPMRRP